MAFAAARFAGGLGFATVLRVFVAADFTAPLRFAGALRRSDDFALLRAVVGFAGGAALREFGDFGFFLDFDATAMRFSYLVFVIVMEDFAAQATPLVAGSVKVKRILV